MQSIFNLQPAIYNGHSIVNQPFMQPFIQPYSHAILQFEFCHKEASAMKKPDRTRKLFHITKIMFSI